VSNCPALQTAYQQRLLDRLQELDIEAEPVRLEEEIVYVLQRADVEEEMDRLDAHLDAIETALAGKARLRQATGFSDAGTQSRGQYAGSNPRHSAQPIPQ